MPKLDELPVELLALFTPAALERLQATHAAELAERDPELAGARVRGHLVKRPGLEPCL